MKLIPFIKKNSSSTENNETNSHGSLQIDETDEDGCCSSSRGQVVQLKAHSKNGHKIVQLGKFLKLKQTAHWENVKMRNGLVIKIHQFRKQVNVILEIAKGKYSVKASEIEETSNNILDMASLAADKILYSEASTMEL